MILVYSYYVLDIIHKGHLEMLRNAKAIAGKDGRLIVGILTDAAVMQEKRVCPILNFEERVELARNIKCIDLVVAQELYSPYDNIKNIKPDILMESTSHKPFNKKMKELIKRLKIKVVTIPYFPNHSSTKIKTIVKREE